MQSANSDGHGDRGGIVDGANVGSEMNAERFDAIVLNDRITSDVGWLDHKWRVVVDRLG